MSRRFKHFPAAVSLRLFVNERWALWVKTSSMHAVYWNTKRVIWKMVVEGDVSSNCLSRTHGMPNKERRKL